LISDEIDGVGAGVAGVDVTGAVASNPFISFLFRLYILKIHKISRITKTKQIISMYYIRAVKILKTK